MQEMSLAALRYSSEQGFVFLARVGDVIENGAEDMHPVIDKNEVHYWHNQQGHAPIPAATVRPSIGSRCHSSRSQKSKPLSGPHTTPPLESRPISDGVASTC